MHYHSVAAAGAWMGQPLWSKPQVQGQCLSWPKHSPGGGHADREMRHREVLHLWVLVLLGVVRTRADLRPQGLDFCNRTELNHLVVF